jgi:RimJ/RimL family protein N-acetyltransferase
MLRNHKWICILAMNPLLLDFPDSFDTERLTIRAPRVEDAAEVIAAVTESLPELRPWMPWAKDAPTLDGTRIRLRQAMANWTVRHDLPLHVYLKGTPTFVMGSGLHRMDWESGKFEIGYWVRTKYMGQGFVTEAVNAITAYAFKELHANRVEIRCDAENIRSAAVAKRCGFLLEGILRHDSIDVEGGLRSTMIYSKLTPNEFNYYDE